MLQPTAKRAGPVQRFFRSYLHTRSVSVQGEEIPAYDEVMMTDENSQRVVHAHRANGTVVTESVEEIAHRTESQTEQLRMWRAI